jgi:hypothetical protein
MYPTITIYDGAATTTLRHGIGARTADEWRLEGAIAASCDYARQTVEPIRATWWTPVARVTRRPRISWQVGRIYTTLAAATEARLIVAATAVAAGTLYVNLSATRRVTHSNAVVVSCTPTQEGLLVRVAWVYDCGAVAAENYT